MVESWHRQEVGLSDNPAVHMCCYHMSILHLKLEEGREGGREGGREIKDTVYRGVMATYQSVVLYDWSLVKQI